MRPDGAGRLRKVGPGSPGARALQVPDGTGGFVPKPDARLLAAQMQAALLAKRCLALVMEATRAACGERPPQSPHREVGMVADPANLTGVVVRDHAGNFFRVRSITVDLERLDHDPFAGRGDTADPEAPPTDDLPEPEVEGEGEDPG